MKVKKKKRSVSFSARDGPEKFFKNDYKIKENEKCRDKNKTNDDKDCKIIY